MPTLPDLLGSPKQIAWAEAIRRSQLAGINSTYAAIRRRPEIAPTDDPRWDALETAILEMTAAAILQTSARYWIETRNTALLDGIRKHARELYAELFHEEFSAIERRRLDVASLERERIHAEVTEAARRREADENRGEHAASGFKPIHVVRSGNQLLVFGEREHEAHGYVEDGEWVIYEIDDIPLNSLLPEATKLASRVRSLMEGKCSTCSS